MRTESSLAGFDQVVISFDENSGRLAGMAWTLDLDEPHAPRSFRAFGESVSIGTLSATVGDPTFETGCGGTFEFVVTLQNTGSGSIALGLVDEDFELWSRTQRLSDYFEIPPQPSECYSSGFTVNSLAAGETVQMGVRTESSLAGSSDVRVYVLGSSILAGEVWEYGFPR
jgi:hypothetical protein